MFFVKHSHAVDKRHKNTSTANHRHYGNHRVRQRQGVEIGQIRAREEDTDKQYRPAPFERRRSGCSAAAQHFHEYQHYYCLVQGIPCLHLKRTVELQEIFVVERTDGTEQCSAYRHPEPSAMLEREAFFGTNAADEKQRGEAEQYAAPLNIIEPLAKDKQCTHKNNHRTRGIYRSLDSQRQMFYGEIAQNPRAQHNHCLKPDEKVAVDSIDQTVLAVCQATDDYRRHQYRAEKRVEQEYCQHIVVAHRQLLHYIIKAQPHGRADGKY